VRRPAKAPFVGSTFGARRGRRGALVVFAALAVTLSTVASASAAMSVADSFGSRGTGDGQFAVAPSDVVVDQSTGNLLIVDEAGHRVERFDADGSFLGQFGRDDLTLPRQLAIAPDGSIYVADGNRVAEFTAAGAYAGEIDTSDSGAFDTALDVVVAPDGSIYVADTGNQRVVKFSAGGDFLLEFSQPGSGAGEFTAQQKLSVDSTGRVYVVGVDPVLAARTVKRFTPAGVFEEVFAPSITTGNSVDAMDIDRTTDDVYLGRYDGLEYRISQVSPAGVEVDAHGVGNREAFGGPLGPLSVAVSSSSGRIYVTESLSQLCRVLIFDSFTAPEASFGTVSDTTPDGARLSGTINPNGSAVHYRFEYSLDGSTWQKASSLEPGLPRESTPIPVSQQLTGLDPSTEYQVRLAATMLMNPPFRSAVTTFTTPAAPPRAETVGTLTRTATTARLDARINPRNSATTYHFEWGPTAAYGNTVPVGPESNLASGVRSVFVSEQIAGLSPNTTYHYRVIATNAAGTTVGVDRTVTTRSGEPLSHGPLPGPPGSDRAWEQVSMEDTNGNPVTGSLDISTDGNRVVYGVAGGTDGSNNGFGGVLLSPWFAERTASGWVSKNVFPDRQAAPGPFWEGPGATDDLSQLLTWNGAPAEGVGASNDVIPTVWRLRPDRSPEKLGSLPLNAFPVRALTSSDDGSVVLISSPLSLDPEHPVPPAPAFRSYLYDYGSGRSRLVSLLPGDAVPPCGTGKMAGPFAFPGALKDAYWRDKHWVAADGSRVFFPADTTSCTEEEPELFMRDLRSEETISISSDPDHGPEMGAAFVGATPGGPSDPDPAVFFWTKSSLVAEDSGPGAVKAGGADDGDIYRYDIHDGSRSCLTCPLGDVDVPLPSVGGRGAYELSVRVSSDGSRLYFVSPETLVPGEGVLSPSEGENLYRLDVSSGDLAFVGVINGISGADFESSEMSRDGSVFVFGASASQLNAYTGSDNGGFRQMYRYDDRDRSLTCLTCPPNGAAHQVSQLFTWTRPPFLSPANSAMSADGGTFVFRSDDPLLPVDQNTDAARPDRGADLYEWRDGRLLLVTNGVTSGGQLRLATITPDGRDVFFSDAAKLTPAAKDGYMKFYDARIGGGFKIEPPPPPCALDVCQGDPTAAPAETPSGSSRFVGPGNVKAQPAKARCAKSRKGRGAKARAKCAQRKSKHVRSKHKRGGHR
jgi:hypothetical protein